MSDWRPRALRPLKRGPFRADGQSADSDGQSPDLQVAPEHSMDPRAVGEAPPAENPVVDNAVYVDGHRTDSPASLADTFRLLRDKPGGMAWIGLYRPAESQLLSVGEEFALHELAVEDAIVAHQRPKLERYGDTRCVRPATWTPSRR